MPIQRRYDGRAGHSGRLTSPTPASWLSILGFKPQVTWRNATAFLIHCSASILFLVFLNASQPFLIHQLESKRTLGHDTQPPSRSGSLSGSLIFYDELLSTFMSLVWGALAELIGLAAVTSTSYLFIALGLVTYTIPVKPWPDLVPPRLVFAIGGSGATAMLSAILSGYSSSRPSQSSIHEPSAQHYDAADSVETGHQHPTQEGDGGPDAEQEQPLLDRQERRHASNSHGKSRYGRVAAIAGVSTGLGALIAVFVLVRLPAKIAEYLERQDPTHEPEAGVPGDTAIRRATIATFWLVAALALLIASITALGLKQPRSSSRRPDRQSRQQDYGALHDSTIALAEDSRQARRARLRHRQERRAHASWTRVIRSHMQQFIFASIGGFRMVAPVRQDVASETSRIRRRLAQELRMAYLGGALARAFTIGTTAFLPLLVTHHYYTSGLCRQLPSPNPESPLPNDELKKLCRSAFTATAILGGTAQLTALLASPVIGLLCDTLSPTSTVSLTSALGAVGFYLLGVGTSGFAGDRQTGEEVPDPLGGLSILAAVLIGLGQIGAIVASLAGCARARSLIVEEQEVEAEVEPSVASDHDDRVDQVSSRGSRSRPRVQTPVAQRAGQGAGAIAGAYTCTGSLSILVISKLGGLLFDMYVPSPFLLIGGFSAFVSLCGVGISIARRVQQE